MNPLTSQVTLTFGRWSSDCDRLEYVLLLKQVNLALDLSLLVPGRPPNSPPDIFNEFENLIRKIDSLNLELYLVADINTNMLPGAVDVNSPKLRNICDIYSLIQWIMEPTRVTAQSQSLIDICKTNTPYKIVASGVMTLDISDHFLVYLVGKAHYTNGWMC